MPPFIQAKQAGFEVGLIVSEIPKIPTRVKSVGGEGPCID